MKKLALALIVLLATPLYWNGCGPGDEDDPGEQEAAYAAAMTALHLARAGVEGVPYLAENPYARYAPPDPPPPESYTYRRSHAGRDMAITYEKDGHFVRHFDEANTLVLDYVDSGPSVDRSDPTFEGRFTFTTASRVLFPVFDELPDRILVNGSGDFSYLTNLGKVTYNDVEINPATGFPRSGSAIVLLGGFKAFMSFGYLGDETVARFEMAGRAYAVSLDVNVFHDASLQRLF